MLTETVTWRPVAEGLPDADLTVLIACDTKFHSEPVWIGFHDGEAWREANGEPAFVTHWAQLPSAPADARMHEQKGESVQAHVQAAAPAGVAAASPVKHWCETCEGLGTIDETLGGEHFSNPKATCPDCDGQGWWTPHTPGVPACAPTEPKGGA